jgi:DNA-binding NarL/FixJ family response regulator
MVSDRYSAVEGRSGRLFRQTGNYLTHSASEFILLRRSVAQQEGLLFTGGTATARSLGRQFPPAAPPRPGRSGPHLAGLGVFHSADESETALLDAIDAGAAAYLTRSLTTADQIVKAVRQAGGGEVLIPASLLAKAIVRQHGILNRQERKDRIAAEFTGRELEVLKLLAEGLHTAGMSLRLGIAPHTIEWHVRHLIEKLQVHSKLQAVVAAARLGLVDLTEE